MSAEDESRPVVVPDLSLVVLIGVSGSGKSTFARRHFRPTQVLSSDFCRGLVADDENDQAATPEAFALLHHIAGVRLRRGLLTVVDATNVKREDRASLVQLARAHDVLPVAIVLDVPEAECLARTEARADRDLVPGVIHRQRADLRRGLRGLGREGFRKVHVLSPDDIERAVITVGEAVQRPARGHRAVRRRRRRPRLPRRARGAAGRARLRAAPGRRRSAGRRRAPGRTARGLRRRPGRPRPGLTRRAAAGHGDGGRRARTLRPRQPREQAGQGAARAQRAGHPRPGADAGPARGRAGGFPPGGRGVLRRAGQPLRAGRRSARGRARRAEGVAAGPLERAGAQLRAVRGHHRGDRRVRPAGALSVGAGVPRPGHRALRPHAGADAGVGQRHALPGHRLRLRRPADRTALPGARARQRRRARGLLRAGAAVPDGRPGGRAEPVGTTSST